MRIRQVIVVVLEESSFIKQAIHLPAVKNTTGTLIYCRLAENWSFSSLYENEGVHNRNAEHLSGKVDNGYERAIRFSHDMVCDVFGVWHVVRGEISECFCVTKEHKKFVVHPPGAWNLNSTCESRWGSRMRVRRRYLLPWWRYLLWEIWALLLFRSKCI